MPDRDRLPVSVIIPVLNEEKNLPDCLASVAWADEVFVVDSQSSDRTGTIAAEHGARVVQGQRVVQVASDAYLGWNTLEESGHYYWRQLRDMKASAEIATLGAKELKRYLGACGWCLAHAHARSGDPIAIAAYLGGGEAFDRAMATFAGAYAAQTRDDWKALKTAIADGALPAQTGV